MKTISSLIILTLASPSTAFANNKKAPVKKKIPTKNPSGGALSRRDLFIAAGKSALVLFCRMTSYL